VHENVKRRGDDRIITNTLFFNLHLHGVRGYVLESAPVYHIDGFGYAMKIKFYHPTDDRWRTTVTNPQIPISNLTINTIANITGRCLWSIYLIKKAVYENYLIKRSNHGRGCKDRCIF
jgi:hypothetical protein